MRPSSSFGLHTRGDGQIPPAPGFGGTLYGTDRSREPADDEDGEDGRDRDRAERGDEQQGDGLVRLVRGVGVALGGLCGLGFTLRLEVVGQDLQQRLQLLALHLG